MNLTENDSSASPFVKKSTRSKDLTSGRQKDQPVRLTEGLCKWDKKASNFANKTPLKQKLCRLAWYVCFV